VSLLQVVKKCSYFVFSLRIFSRPDPSFSPNRWRKRSVLTAGGKKVLPTLSFLSIGYLWRYFILFCSYEINWTRMLQIVFLVSLESCPLGGVHGLDSMMFGLAVQKFLNIEWSSLKIKLNRSWKFRRNWNVPLVLLERSWWAGFSGI
jgi:hypothetical protein